MSDNNFLNSQTILRKNIVNSTKHTHTQTQASIYFIHFLAIFSSTRCQEKVMF